MAAQILSSPSKARWDHDVFLSFRGDTRKNFTDRLYEALVLVRVRTFRDNEELPRGKIISDELRKAICGSRIYIVVFSQGYASSTWCLDELAEIVDCRGANEHHTLLPIFYHVDPSDVRKQTGIFAEAFFEHEKRFHTDMGKVERWRKALAKAGSLSGWDVSSIADGYEGKVIEKIVDQVLRELNQAHLHVPEHLVEMDSRVAKVKALLAFEKSDVHIVGIYGMGGIGKTTIAIAIYNQIYLDFEGSSCLLDIKEISKEVGGLVRLQKKLLREILKKDVMIDHTYEGIVLIKKMLSGKRVLIVLDDVDDLDQVHELFGELSWFGLGSRIIFTTRDEQLLAQLQVDDKYKVSPLDESKSLELFSWHAFKMPNPIESFLELSISAVKYVEGLPLALKVLGSFLKKKSHDEWKSELEKLQRQPHDKIQKVLRISFDSLDKYTKDIFLDIACFFVGTKKDYATKIFDGCGFFPNSGMEILKRRSLLTIDAMDKLLMHSLIQEMGKNIVREKATYVLKNYSRLWFHEDVHNVLSKNMGLLDVEGLSLNSPKLEGINLKTGAFTNMKNLRLLQINVTHLIENFQLLSNELRWLCWHNCSLKILPQDLYLGKFVVLDLQESKLIQVWKGYKVLNELKVLNLRNSKNLTKSPNFSGVQHLETLILKGCTKLVEVHESIGCLKGFVKLNLRGCISLTNLPSSIGNLESLKTLDISYCSRLFECSKQVGSMMALTKLHGNETTIEHKLSFLGLSKNHKIDLPGYQQKFSNSLASCLSCYISTKSSISVSSMLASLSRFHYLEELNLSYCGLFEDNFPNDLEILPSLTILDLSGNNFCNTPRGISRLDKLLFLSLDGCKTLQSISELPTSLYALTLDDTLQLRQFSNSLDMTDSPSLFYCESHNQVNLQRLISSPLIFFHKNSIQEEPSCEGIEFPIIFLQNTEVPDWFSHQAVGSLISFRVPSFVEGRIDEITICASYRPLTSTPNSTSNDGPIVAISFYNKTRGGNLSLHTKVPLHFATACCHIYRIPLDLIGRGPCQYSLEHNYYFSLDSHRIYRTYDLGSSGLRIDSLDEMEVSIEFHGDFEVHKCGIHLPLRSFPARFTVLEDNVVVYKGR